MWSFHYRGTEEAPGLVLALEEDRDAVCDGLALRPRSEEAEEVVAGVRRRELVSDAYQERRVRLELADGREVEALAFVARTEHRQYACVDAETQARTIAQGRGEGGPNLDYLGNTAERLRGLGIRDGEMESLWARTRDVVG